MLVQSADAGTEGINRNKERGAEEAEHIYLVIRYIVSGEDDKFDLQSQACLGERKTRDLDSAEYYPYKRLNR